MIEDLEQRLLVECCKIRIKIEYWNITDISRNARSLRSNFWIFGMARLLHLVKDLIDLLFTFDSLKVI